MLVFQELWVYLSIVIFSLKFNCCAWVYILKFCPLKIVNGAVDARKWSAISDIVFSLRSIEGRKKRRRPKAFAPCMGKMPSERVRQENGFLVLTLVILRVEEDLRGLMTIV